MSRKKSQETFKQLLEMAGILIYTDTELIAIVGRRAMLKIA